MEIYRARWILPVTSPALKDSVLVCDGGRILEVVPAAKAEKEYPSWPVTDFGEAVITPGLVNAHCHLELSALAGKIHRFDHFLQWVGRLITARQSMDEELLISAARQAMEKMRACGTVLVGDITNGTLLAKAANEPVQRVVFFELIGFIEEAAGKIFEEARALKQRVNPAALITPHAPFSVSEKLLRLIKEHNAHISIHAAESREEADFFLRGSASMQAFLQSRQAWNGRWQTPGISPVAYLDRCGILDENTLLIHAVQVDDQDIRIIAERGSSVCLCLRSNDYLGVGRPRASAFLEAGIPLCVGTDSLASNRSLDMNEELYYLSNTYPEVDAAEWLRMATLNGARALGLEADFGSLQPGRKAHFNVYRFSHRVDSEPEQAVISKQWSVLQCF